LIFGILWSYSNNIPDYRFLKSYKPPVSSKVYSGDGDLVADFSKEKRIFIPFNSIPKNVINSFFYQQKIKISFLIQVLMQKEF
jgi:penicillin-binding protein 1A